MHYLPDPMPIHHDPLHDECEAGPPSEPTLVRPKRSRNGDDDIDDLLSTAPYAPPRLQRF